jgi:limonene-1,2-epoxide hydrolase
MRIAATLLVLLALTACGGRSVAPPRDVVRAWSAALDRNDNEAAGSLFAPAAEVVQNGGLTKLSSHADAVRWNSLLPCGGDITSLTLRGKQQVVAVFKLKERPGHSCDAPGAQAAAIFEIQGGKIVIWHQTAVPAPAGSGLFA